MYVYSQFDGFVPVDNITRQSERLEANDVYIAALRADVQPLALKRQMTVTDSTTIPLLSAVSDKQRITN